MMKTQETVNINQKLNELREMSKDFIDQMRNQESSYLDLNDLHDLASQFLDLDKYITESGMLPDDWNRGEN